MVKIPEKYTLIPLFDTLDHIADTTELGWDNAAHIQHKSRSALLAEATQRLLGEI